MNPWAQNLF